MQQRIKVTTFFDVTETNVVRTRQHSDSAELKKRHQQSNFETVLQGVSLRTQPLNISKPKNNNSTWTFEFDIEAAMVFSKGDDPLGLLKDDLNGVPMIVGLDERKNVEPYIIVAGDQQNIWFEADV